MRFVLLAFAAAVALLLAPMAATAGVACNTHCDQASGMPCCAEKPMPCCAKEPEPIGSAIDMLIAMDPDGIQPHAHDAVSPRQTAVVWFHQPVVVGRTVLLGKYVIEHDTDRQARGEPCTHIYAAGKLTAPVATFHCTHLDATHADHDTVVLGALQDGLRKLVRFQFAGESAAHGYPTDR